jgi:hypothetical protein
MPIVTETFAGPPLRVQFTLNEPMESTGLVVSPTYVPRFIPVLFPTQVVAAIAGRPAAIDAARRASARKAGRDLAEAQE